MTPQFLSLLLVPCLLVFFPACSEDLEDPPAPNRAPTPEAAPNNPGTSESTQPVPTATAAATPPTSPAAPAPSPPVEPPLPPLLLTQELEASSVSIMVSVGGAIKRNYSGVILEPGLFDPPLDGGSQNRMIAALIPDYTEADLRDESCKIRVQRNLFDDGGIPRYVSRPARLASYDAASHVVVLCTKENFPYRQDGKVARSMRREQLYALLPSHDGSLLPPQPRPHLPRPAPGEAELPQPPAPPLWPVPFRVDLSPVGRSGEVLTLEGTGLPSLTHVPATLALLGADGGLAGFAAMQPDQTWLYCQAVVPPVDTRGVRYMPESVRFEHPQGAHIEVFVEGKVHDIFGEVHSFRAAYRPAPGGKLSPPAPESVQSHPPLDGAVETSAYRQPQSKQISLSLPTPRERDGSAVLHHEVQILLFNSDRQLISRSAPFLVTLDRRGEAVYPSVEGATLIAPASSPSGTPPLPDAKPANDELAAIDIPVTTLSTGVPVRHVFAIRGGRELLVHLEQAPHWKRLSLEKKEWLPLPGNPLERMRLAGNEEAIFLLDPQSRRLVRYHGTTLALEAESILPATLTLMDLSAGAGSADAPLALLCAEGIYACDPHTLEATVLEPPTLPTTSAPQAPARCVTSGDGRVHQMLSASTYNRLSRDTHIYSNYYRNFTGQRHLAPWGSEALTVAPDYLWNSNNITYPLTSGKAARLMAVSSSAPRRYREEEPGLGPLVATPVYARSTLNRVQQAPPLPGTVALHSLLTMEPFAEFTSPEVAETGRLMGAMAGDRVFLDPYSLSVAVWHQETALTVRTLDRSRLPATKQPVLLNFPSGVAARGRTYRFEPVILGTPGWKVEVAPKPAGMEVTAQGAITWPVPADYLPDVTPLNIKITPAEGTAPVQFSTSLVSGGLPPVIAAPVQAGAVSVNEALSKVAAGGPVPSTLVPLSSWTYTSPRKIQSVLQGLTDYVALQYEDKALALYSPKDKKITGSAFPTERGTLFLAGDCALYYDSSVGTLTRLSLPDFGAEVTVVVPDRSGLVALGVGAHPDSPVTLLLDDSKTSGFRTSSNSHRLVVLEKKTLRHGKWAQHTLVKGIEADPAAHSAEMRKILQWQSYNSVGRIPTSTDGRVASLPAAQFIISPALTVGVLYPPPLETPGVATPTYHHFESTSNRLQSSPTGDRLVSDRETLIGARTIRWERIPDSVAFSTCGNFLAYPSVTTTTSPATSPTMSPTTATTTAIAIGASDHQRGLLSLHRVDGLFLSDGYSRSPIQAVPFGDRNLIVAKNRGGHLLQFIPCDVPAILAEVDPATVMVTSHIVPFVAAGRTIEYPITVNRPDAVSEFRLRDKIPNASVSRTGTFVYRSASQLKEPLALHLAVEIELKSGIIIPHEFPLNVVPVR